MRRHDELVIELLALRVVDQAHVTILANLPDRFAGAAAVFPQLSLGDLSVAEFDTLVAKRLRLPKRLHCYA